MSTHWRNPAMRDGRPLQALERQLEDRSRQLAASQADLSDLGALQTAAAIVAAAARDTEVTGLRKALGAQAGRLISSEGVAKGLILQLAELQRVVDRKEGLLRASQVTAEGLVAQYAQLAEMLAAQAPAVHNSAELRADLLSSQEACVEAELALRESEARSVAAAAQHEQQLSVLQAVLADAEESRCGKNGCMTLHASFGRTFPGSVELPSS